MLPFRNKKIARWLFVLFVLFVLAYAFFEARNIVLGPQILIATPPGGTTVTSQLVEITGNTKNIQDITLEGRDIYIDEEGVFTERLLLSPGYNIFIFEAKDKFDRHTKKTLELIYKPIEQLEEATTTETDINQLTQ